MNRKIRNQKLSKPGPFSIKISNHNCAENNQYQPLSWTVTPVNWYADCYPGFQNV